VVNAAYDRLLAQRKADDEEHDGVMRVKDLRECVMPPDRAAAMLDA
jgi:hypothetical protein